MGAKGQVKRPGGKRQAGQRPGHIAAMGARHGVIRQESLQSQPAIPQQIVRIAVKSPNPARGSCPHLRDDGSRRRLKPRREFGAAMEINGIRRNHLAAQGGGFGRKTGRTPAAIKNAGGDVGCFQKKHPGILPPQPPPRNNLADGNAHAPTRPQAIRLPARLQSGTRTKLAGRLQATTMGA